MGAIEKYVVNQTGRAIDTVQNFGDRVTSALSRIQGYLGTAFEVAKNGETFVGLQYSAVENITSSIETYVKNVQTVIDKLNTDASTDNALRGDVADAAKEYVSAVSQVARAYVSALNAYKKKMNDYHEQYKAADTTLTSNVREEANALASTAEEYSGEY